MEKTVLITGGAGFIASHCAAAFLRSGYRVRALDNLDPQIHGPERNPPSYLERGVELLVGDIRSAKTVRRALAGVDAVLHLAARVGVGQSMYEVADYTDVNSRGTAVLLEAMIERAKRRPFDRLVVASSMSIYGEGRYRASNGQLLDNLERSSIQLKKGLWEPLDSYGRACVAVPTDESKPPSMLSVYGLSKFDQERLCLLVGGAYDIPTVALRFFNVYGPHQALSNPYRPIEPEITGECRVGDVRHCFPDISAARAVLGYRPRTQLQAGLIELVSWLKGRVAVDRVGEASVPSLK